MPFSNGIHSNFATGTNSSEYSTPREFDEKLSYRSSSVKTAFLGGITSKEIT